MRHSSGSQASGGKPFCKRASFVLSNAVRSIVVGSSKDGSEGARAPAASVVTSEVSPTRLGREAALITELDINRATGCPWLV